MYCRQSTSRAANSRDFLYHSKQLRICDGSTETICKKCFISTPLTRTNFANKKHRCCGALWCSRRDSPSPAQISQIKSTAVAVRCGAVEGTRKERSDGIAIVACGNNDSGGETCFQSIKRRVGTGGGRNVTKRANRVSRRVRRRKPRANVAQSPETKKKHRGCGAFWCALRDSNPGPTD